MPEQIRNLALYPTELRDHDAEDSTPLRMSSIVLIMGRKAKLSAAIAQGVKALAAITGAVLIGGAALSPSGPDLTRGETGQVTSVLDGDTLYLEGGLQVRLSAIQAPQLPLGLADFKAWPLGQDARRALSVLTKGQEVGLFYGGARRDRYERALAQIFTLKADGTPDLWVQQEMVRLGWARVYTWPDTFQDSALLYKAEREAREAGRGIWSDEYYAIRSPEPNMLAQDVDSIQVVEGLVTSAADIRGLVYLNFGADYKTDFTIAIAKSDRKAFEQAGLDPMSLEGARVRVRGWIELINGPMIWLDHPERLEVLN